MTTRSLLTILLTATALSLLSPPPIQAARPVRINIGTLAPRGSSVHKSLMTLSSEWKKISEGKVKVVIYPDGTQGGEADMVRLMRIGSLQGGALTSIGLADIVKEIGGLQGLPLMFDSYAELDYVNEKMKTLFKKRFDEKGFVLLFWADAGWIHFFSKEKMTTPTDLKKMKMFLWAGDPAHAKVVKNAGYRGIPLETAEIQTGLQTGLIDVADMPPIFALAAQIDARAKHMLALNWAPLLGGLIVKKDAWNKIPTKTRAALLEAAETIGAEMRANNRKESVEAIKAMEKRGLIVHPVDAATAKIWRTECEKSVYPQMIDHSIPKSTFETIQTLLGEYKKDHPKGNE